MLDFSKLPDREWLDQEAEREPEKQYAEEERAIAAHKEARKRTEAQTQDFLSRLRFKASDLEKENREENAYADESLKAVEEELASREEADETETMSLHSLDMNLAPQTVTGSGPGHYYDFNPYHCWWRWYTHNEGGRTTGRAGCSRSARKMYLDAYARGDGPGFWDDNYTTCWSKLFFAFWPRRNGHVRAFVPFTTRGWYRIYANDKWYNSKSAEVDLDVQVQLHQNYWGGRVKDDVFRIRSGNVNRSGRIDRSRTLYSGGIPVGANKWVIAEVTTRAHAYTSGGGSTARLAFWPPDNVFAPYVRFDFS